MRGLYLMIGDASPKTPLQAVILSIHFFHLLYYNNSITGGMRMNEFTLSKELIEQEYKFAWFDFCTAHTEDDQWNARKRMARLERSAAEMYGFDYADSLLERAKADGIM